MKLSDIAETDDTLEILKLKEELVDAANRFDKALEANDLNTAQFCSDEVDTLTLRIFRLRESILKPYPATVPSELSPMEQTFLFSETDKLIGDWHVLTGKD